jgi:hypothetical protein
MEKTETKKFKERELSKKERMEEKEWTERKNHAVCIASALACTVVPDLYVLLQWCEPFSFCILLFLF